MAESKSIRKRIRTRKKRVSGNCVKCGVWRYGLHHDHIVPKWKGGPDTPDNIQHLCGNCHEDKTREEQTGYSIRSSVRYGYPVRGTPGPNQTKFKAAHRRSGNCVKCGVYHITLHRDHIIPKFKGGPDTSDNIQLLCANCHEDKTLQEQRGVQRGPMSEEQKQKLSQAHKGKRFSEQHRMNIGKAKRGLRHTDAAKRQMSIARMGNQNRIGIPHSAATKAQMSESRSGPGNVMYGKHHKEETKRKISSALQGRPSPKKGKPGQVPNAETRARMSAASKGKPKSTETRRRMSDAARRRHQKHL